MFVILDGQEMALFVKLNISFCVRSNFCCFLIFKIFFRNCTNSGNCTNTYGCFVCECVWVLFWIRLNCRKSLFIVSLRYGIVPLNIFYLLTSCNIR